MRREKYYSSENAMQKSGEWSKLCKSAKKHAPYQFVPCESALLILDMQNFFVSPDSHAFVPSAIEIIPNIRILLEFFIQNHFPIVFTRHLSDLSERDLMNSWWRDQISLNEKKSDIINQLDTSLGEVLIKHQYSAFYNTNLHDLLMSNGIHQLVITGVLTHLCCESTAREAFMRGYQVFFPFDATATYNESLHIGSLQAISHGFGICLPTQALITTTQ